VASTVAPLRRQLPIISGSTFSEIPEYAELAEGLGSAAGRINGKYGEVSWTPNRTKRGVVSSRYDAARPASIARHGAARNVAACFGERIGGARRDPPLGLPGWSLTEC
jgi:hypothetical protein